MWRFVLRENIRRFQALLEHARSKDERDTLEELLAEAEVELQELEEASTPEVANRDAVLDSLARQAIDHAMELQGAQFASLQLFDESRDHLTILAQRNLRAKFLHYLAQMKAGDGSGCGRCLAENTSVSIDDVSHDEAFRPHRQAASEAGFRAVRAFPVRDTSGRILAVLSTYFEAPQSFTDDDAARMSALTDALGRNLESHRAMAFGSKGEAG